MSDTAHMAANPCIQCRVTPEAKARLRGLALQRHLTESMLLQQLVEGALLQTIGGATESEVSAPVEPISRTARVFVRLRPEDHLLLKERAGRRSMAVASYASLVLRVHLRNVTPLPDREIAELRRAVAALGMVGRNLNQIAKVAHQSGQAMGPNLHELRSLLKVCAALRDHVKGLITANIASWENGRDEAHS